MGLMCVKCSFLFFVSVLLVAALASVAVGAWLLASSSYRDILDLAADASQDDTLQTSVVLLISVGMFTALLVGLACGGAVHASRCMLRIFILFVVITSVIELIGVAMAASFRNNALPHMWSSLENSLVPQRYYDGEGPRTFGSLMNAVQQQVQCCGVNNATDYDLNGFPDRAANGSTFFYPYSCCVLVSDSNRANPGPEDALNWEGCQDELPSYFYHDGCAVRFIQSVDDTSEVVLFTGLITLFLQVVSIVLAGCLWRAITKDYYY